MPKKKKATSAKDSLAEAANEAALVLSGIMLDDDVKPDLRLAAAKEILNRAQALEKKDGEDDPAVKIEIDQDIEPFTV